MERRAEMPAICKRVASIFSVLALLFLFSAPYATPAFADEGPAAEETWTKVNTCEWRFDEASKTLIVRPYQNADSGYLSNLASAPWRGQKSSIEFVDFRGKISLNGACEELFRGCRNLRSFKGLEALDTSKATSLKCFFYDCPSLEALDIGEWDTSNVTSLLGIFYNCQSLESLDLSHWDTSNVASLNWTFNGCSSLKSLNIDGWDTSNVSDMWYMFSNCRSLEALDVSHFIYSPGVNVQHMFEYCTSLKSIDFSSCDLLLGDNTYKGRYGLLGLFEGCTSLEYADLSGLSVPFDSDVTPFIECTSLARVKIGPEFDGRIAFPMGYWSDEQGECFEEFDIPQNVGGVYTYMGTVKEAMFPADSIMVELSGGRYKIPISFVSRGMQEADISWTSSNPEVASVDSSGVVRPYKTGKTTITVIADRISAKCDVLVVDTPKSPESPVDPVPEVPNIDSEDNMVPEQPAEPITSATPIKPSTPSVSLKGVSVKKLTKLQKGFKVKWSKLPSKYLRHITGYKVRYSTSKSMKKAKTKTVKASSSNGKKLTLKVTKLKAKKKYYVQVATYRKIAGNVYCSKWSKVKSVKTK